MPTLTIERKGGVAGIGLSGSRIRSRGQVEWGSLSAKEQTAIDRLFAQRGTQKNNPDLRDAFTYRISRSDGGSSETIEIGEAAVPDVLRQAVKDELV